MKLLVLFFVLFLITNILENYFRERERFTLINRYGNYWHSIQFVMWALVIIYILYLNFNFTVGMIITILFISSLWWLLFDGFLNLLRGRNFFYISEFTTSRLEKFASPKNKLILLVISSLFLLLSFYTKLFYKNII